MSKIALPIAELKPALTGLAKVISRHSALPVLNHLKIERTRDGWVALTATDLEAFVTVRLEQPSQGETLSLLVPYDELLKINKSCPKTDTLLLDGDSKAVTIQYAIGSLVAETRVDSLPVEEFPEIPRIKGEPIPMNDVLRQAIHEAMECASTDVTRPIINSAYIDVSREDGHYVVGTDGRHLFSSNSFKLPLKECFILPTHKFLGYREFNQDGEWQLKLATPQHKDDAARFQVSSRRWRFISRQIDGAFPNWRQVVPGDSQFVTSIQLDAEQLKPLADTIERLPEHDALNHTIGIERKDRAVNLLWKPDREQEWKRLPVTAEKLTGQDMTIYLNRHLLAKALRFGLHRIALIDPMSPLRFSHEGRQMIVMPVRADLAPTKPNPPASGPVAAGSAAATPVPANSPESTPPPIAEQPERKPMPEKTNGNTNAAPPPTNVAEKPALATALAQIEIVRGDFRNAIAGLNKLSEVLKQAQREHKAGDKEVQSVRQTLRSLQAVRI